MRGVGTPPVGHRVAPPQWDQLVQVVLLRTVHEDGRFSVTASTILPLGTVPLSSEAVCLAHMAQF